MPIVNRIAEFAEDMKAWRRHLHQNPELGFDCHETAAFVVERLQGVRHHRNSQRHCAIGARGFDTWPRPRPSDWPARRYGCAAN